MMEIDVTILSVSGGGDFDYSEGMLECKGYFDHHAIAYFGRASLAAVEAP